MSRGDSEGDGEKAVSAYFVRADALLEGVDGALGLGVGREWSSDGLEDIMVGFNVLSVRMWSWSKHGSRVPVYQCYMGKWLMLQSQESQVRCRDLMQCTQI